MDKEKADMIIYTTEDGLTKVETTFDGDTVWLSIDQMAELFQRDCSVIGKHVRNIFKEGELEKESVWQNLPTLLLMEKFTMQIITILMLLFLLAKVYKKKV